MDRAKGSCWGIVLSVRGRGDEEDEDEQAGQGLHEAVWLDDDRLDADERERRDGDQPAVVAGGGRRDPRDEQTGDLEDEHAALEEGSDGDDVQPAGDEEGEREGDQPAVRGAAQPAGAADRQDEAGGTECRGQEQVAGGDRSAEPVVAQSRPALGVEERATGKDGAGVDHRRRGGQGDPRLAAHQGDQGGQREQSVGQQPNLRALALRPRVPMQA
ncbi:hypothetical protein GCM10010358_25650 [Streptomyces minutiscleroticus]|uniref:Uncharacterized protein n=1 Tax=Streptomyces minutiscleroticus TaxID=68238 RepID=A0A918KQ04_9ACTN|nr:hypothetical protein GCM10010358_25650 [Streptomyces minutiscleroticus]